jgi:hypothetical protein
MAEEQEEKCACGKPLHYTDPTVRKVMDQLVKNLGPTIRVTIVDPKTKEPKTYLVQRHFIALHGLNGWEVAGLGFPEAT